jgi:hypothetical protein
MPELGITGEAPPRYKAKRSFAPSRGNSTPRGSANGDDFQPSVPRGFPPDVYRVSHRRERPSRCCFRFPPRRVTRVVSHARAPRDEKSSFLRSDTSRHDSCKHGVKLFRVFHFFTPLPNHAFGEPDFPHQRNVVPPPRSVVRQGTPVQHDTLHESPRAYLFEPLQSNLSSQLKRAFQQFALRISSPMREARFLRVALSHRGVPLQGDFRIARYDAPKRPNTRPDLHIPPSLEVLRGLGSSSAFVRVRFEPVQRNAQRVVCDQPESPVRFEYR